VIHGWEIDRSLRIVSTAKVIGIDQSGRLVAQAKHNLTIGSLDRDLHLSPTPEGFGWPTLGKALEPSRSTRSAREASKNQHRTATNLQETGRVFDNQECVLAVLGDDHERSKRNCALSRLCDRCMPHWRSLHRIEFTLTFVLANFTWLVFGKLFKH
jgi:hypothetical protein